MKGKPGWRKKYAARAAEAAGKEPIRTDFLVYGECSCGWWCACPEGASWPECPKCGAHVLPLRNLDSPHPDHKQGYGYVAELRPEIDAYTIRHDRVWPESEEATDYIRHHGKYPPGPIFDAKEVRQNIEERFRPKAA